MTRSLFSLLLAVLLPASASLAQQPDLAAFSTAPLHVDAGLPFPVAVSYSNVGGTAATGVTISISIADAVGFTHLPAGCGAEGARIVCAVGDVPPSRQSRQFAFDAIAPDASHTPLPIVTTIASNEPDADPSSNTHTTTIATYRTFVVSSTEDSGPGTLRDAITEANAACVDLERCKVAFRIPGSATIAHTIQPRSPLPIVRAGSIFIDGVTQERYVGNANAVGPDIVLDGSALIGDADGLAIESPCAVVVRGLAIHSFPANGIRIAGGLCQGTFISLRTIEKNYIGTDATGTEARPNLRGIRVETELVGIEDNLVSGNTRSGVYVVAPRAAILRNIIGLDRMLRPLGNGASGVYVGPGGSGTDLTDNYVGFNAHYGLAIDANARQCAIGANSFQANGGQAIDFGLDGPTLEVPSAYVNVPMPVITTAYYDASADETIIEGTADVTGTSVHVNVYANDAPDPGGYGEGQYHLGFAPVDGRRWRFVWKGRTYGPHVAATTTRSIILGAMAPRPDGAGGGAESVTSEFSRTVEVH